MTRSDSGPKLVMKGSSVRVRASALKHLQIAHFRMPNGRKPEPGGWNRIQVVVDGIAAKVERLRAGGLQFRNDIVSEPGARQILLDDPPATRSSSSNPPPATDCARAG
jgi:hypothetical protein